uniref:Uncharacterized protein n=1 Tax=Romanomermis culicivorax TaxID=13658 RepID=A0A915HYY0_ROMCU
MIDGNIQPNRTERKFPFRSTMLCRCVPLRSVGKGKGRPITDEAVSRSTFIDKGRTCTVGIPVDLADSKLLNNKFCRFGQRRRGGRGGGGLLASLSMAIGRGQTTGEQG